MGALHLRENEKIITFHLREKTPFQMREGIDRFSISKAQIFFDTRKVITLVSQALAEEISTLEYIKRVGYRFGANTDMRLLIYSL